MSDASWDRAEARAWLDAEPGAVADLFWDIAAWHAIWSPIDDVEVLYDDGVHQEFAMGVQRDGRREDVRTIRYRHDSGDIGFFSPRPPPTMATHNGAWLFHPDPGSPGSPRSPGSPARCRVTARRDYRLLEVPGESAGELAVRRSRYRERFEDRLQAILGCFEDHFAAPAPARPLEVTA